MGPTVSSAKCLTMLRSRGQQGCVSYWGSREESVSKFLRIVGRMQFLKVVGLWSYFLLAAGQGCSLLVETLGTPSHAFHSILASNTG